MAHSLQVSLGEHRSCSPRLLSLHTVSLASDYKSPASPTVLQTGYEDGRSLLHGLPGLSLKALVNWLCYGGLHQIHISNHQRSIQILEVFVELSIAQVICVEEKKKRQWQKNISFFVPQKKKKKKVSERMRELTVVAEEVVEKLEEGEAVPALGGLDLEGGIHVDGVEGQEVLCMLHHEVCPPCKGLDRAGGRGRENRWTRGSSWEKVWRNKRGKEGTTHATGARWFLKAGSSWDMYSLFNIYVKNRSAGNALISVQALHRKSECSRVCPCNLQQETRGKNSVNCSSLINCIFSLQINYVVTTVLRAV